MSPLVFEIAMIDGRWGFWAESYNQFALGPELRKQGSPRETIKLRQRLIAEAPKERKFYPLRPPPPGFSADFSVHWVGHLACLPNRRAREALLGSGSHPRGLIAEIKTPGGRLLGVAAVLFAADDGIVPVASCDPHCRA